MERCSRCLLQRALCICAEIPRIATSVRVVIVRHVLEKHRSSNSARVAALALENAEIVDHGHGAEVPPLGGDGTWLVYPEGEPRRTAPAPPPSRLVFLDGTWHQARRMRQRLESLRGLPILSLPIDDVPAARLRESPGRGRVSTIEAIAAALRLCESEEAAVALERLFGLLVARSRRAGRR